LKIRAEEERRIQHIKKAIKSKRINHKRAAWKIS
jgi:hypothetical protein